MPHATAHPQQAPVFPLVYAMRFVGRSTCGAYRDGDLMAINTLEEPLAGDVVCVHLKEGMAQLMYLAMPLAPGMFDRMPWQPGHAEEIIPAIIGHGVSGGFMQFRATDVWAVHKCDGKHDPDMALQAAA